MLFAFLLHGIEVRHDHPHHPHEKQEQDTLGEDLSLVLHVNDRKVVVDIAPPQLAFKEVMSAVALVPTVPCSGCKRVITTDHYKELFRRGLLNKKYGSEEPPHYSTLG